MADYGPPNDTIFVSGLPELTTESEISEFFGQIGVIKIDKKTHGPKIWIYKDKDSGKGKGEATITYDDPPTATSAISWFNGKEFHGSKITVDLAQRKSVPQFNRGGRGGGGFNRGGSDKRPYSNDKYSNDQRGGERGFDRGGLRNDRGGRGGGGGSGGGGGGRPGDWLCPSCSNNNFAYRRECNRCRTKKPFDEGGSIHGGNLVGGYRDRERERDRDRDREPKRDRSRDRDRDRDRERDRERFGDRNRGFNHHRR